MDVSVKIRCLKNAAREMDAYEGMLDEYIVDVTEIKNSLSFKIKTQARIYSDLNVILNALYFEKRKVRQLSTSLKDIADRYVSTENLVASSYGKKTSAKWAAGVAFMPMPEYQKNQMTEKLYGNTYDAAKTRWSDSLPDLFLKLIGAAGMSGTLISGLGQMMTGESGFHRTTSGLKGITKLVEQYISGRDANATWKEMILGTRQAHTKGFMENLKGQFIKTKDVNGVKVISKGATMAKWAGNALTVANSAYNNYTEAGNQWTQRAVAETVIESTVDIGIGAALGAAAGAAGAVIGAPAVAVGAATVVAVWGVNEGWKQISGGKSIAESTSDFILDKAVPAVQRAGERIENALSEGTKKAGDSVKKVLCGISVGWQRMATVW